MSNSILVFQNLRRARDFFSCLFMVGAYLICNDFCRPTIRLILLLLNRFLCRHSSALTFLGLSPCHLFSFLSRSHPRTEHFKSTVYNYCVSERNRGKLYCILFLYGGTNPDCFSIKSVCFLTLPVGYSSNAAWNTRYYNNTGQITLSS